MIALLDAVLTFWALTALGFTLVLLVRLARRRASALPARGPGEVLLLRPVEAASPAELANLSLKLPGVRQVVISPYRPPLPAHVEWLPWEPIAPNRKVSHLAAALAHFGPRAVVVAADADVRVSSELLDALIAPVEAGAQLCTAAPRVEAEGPGGLALAGVLDHSALSFTAVDAMTVGARAVCGKAMALGPAAQALLPRLTRVVGEDLELSSRLAAGGHRVELAGLTAEVRAGHLPLAATFARMTRWMQVLRAHRPGLFPTVPLLIAPSLPLLLAVGLARAPVAALALGALAASRVVLAFALRPAPRAAWAWALGEAVLVAAFCRALFKRDVVWRGQRLRLEPGGGLQ